MEKLQDQNQQGQNQNKSNTRKIILIVIAVIVAGAGGYLAYRQVMNWHKKELNTVENKSGELEGKVNQLQEELATYEEPPVPESRMTEVFGDKSVSFGEGNCDELKSRITSYFNYLDQKPYAKSYAQEAGGTYQLYIQMVQSLSKNPPMITDERRDIVSLTHNSAHFFRVLNKNRIAFVKNILAEEKDIIEPTLANFYGFYASGKCYEKEQTECPSPEILYEYAGFFLNTLSGKSYLMRRDSIARSLITYYSVLILDRANDDKLNRYGIDIRPHIDLSMNDISNQKKLIFHKQYIGKLEELKKKYQR